MSQKMEDVWKSTETMERDGLDSMDWIDAHSDCRAGREEKSKLVAERSKETAEKTGTAEDEAGRGRTSATMFSEPGTWTLDNITGELGDVGKMARLSGRTHRRGTEKGVGERLMIGEKGKLMGFEEETEMAYGGVSSKEFMIKGGVLGFRGD